MLPERNISIALAAIGAALALPAAESVLHGFAVRSTGAPITGAILGTFGVFFGALVARSHTASWAVRIAMSLWLIIAVLFGAMLALLALQTVDLGLRALLSILALLPLAAWTFVITHADV